MMPLTLIWGLYKYKIWEILLVGVKIHALSYGHDETNLVGSAPAASFTGLLDDYSGAAAAYSLRQLSSTYSGDAIVVRRASDNTTQAIGFVDNELDTASLETFCSGTDGFVTTWYDQSGASGAADMTQSTASKSAKNCE